LSSHVNLDTIDCSLSGVVVTLEWGHIGSSSSVSLGEFCLSISDRENLLKEARDLAKTVADAEAEFTQRNATRATDMAPLKSDYDTAKGAVDGIKVDMAAQQAIMDGSAEG
jgi:hypothetical protein